MKKRILFIAQYPPPVHGAAMMSQYIKDSKQISETFDCDYLNLSTSRKMNEVGKWSFIKSWRLLVALFRLLGKLMKHQYDICYITLTCHGGPFLKDTPFALLCKMFSKKLVIHQHNKGMSIDVEKWPYRWLIPFVYENTTVILLSWKLYPDISTIVPKDNVVICANGIPGLSRKYDEDVRNIIKKRKESRTKQIHLLYLSNMIADKGIWTLLEACKILENKSIDYRCTFVGGWKDVSEEEFREKVISLGIQNRVVAVGPRFGKEKDQYWDSADVFIFPTFYKNECFPLVLLEAMQHGLACVSTKEGAIPDIIEDGKTGFVINQKDCNALALKIEQLANNRDLCAEMGSAGYSKYKEIYTLNIFEKNLCEILDSTT